jgi:hypothetical protein
VVRFDVTYPIATVAYNGRPFMAEITRFVSKQSIAAGSSSFNPRDIASSTMSNGAGSAQNAPTMLTQVGRTRMAHEMPVST